VVGQLGRLGPVGRNEGRKLTLKPLGSAGTPAVCDRLGKRIGEDILLAALNAIENAPRRSTCQ
jgi:hypothetical protein